MAERGTPRERLLRHAGYLDRLGRKSLANELRAWMMVSAKFAYMLANAEEVNASEDVKEKAAVELLAHAIENELKALEEA